MLRPVSSSRQIGFLKEIEDEWSILGTTMGWLLGVVPQVFPSGGWLLQVTQKLIYWAPTTTTTTIELLLLLLLPFLHKRKGLFTPLIVV